MKLFEFEAKNILKQYGITVPRGSLVRSAGEAARAAREIGRPVAIKSQVLVAGRGKAGGILFADTLEEAESAASKLLGSDIKGIPVTSLLIEEKLDLADQYYASVAIDRQAKTYTVLASTSGGVDIEEVAQKTPERIARHRVDAIKGFDLKDALNMLGQFPLDTDTKARLTSILDTLFNVATDHDAELVEMNPLVTTTSGEFVAADARIIVDDNALFRHPEFQGRSSDRAEDTPLEAEARRQNLAYVDLPGDIGIIGNGAGLMMATLDVVDVYGGKPANFLDIGGGAQVEVIKKAVMMVMSKPAVKAVLINILGGITRCDLVAQGVVEALRDSDVKKPIAVRMIGTNEEEGTRILQEAGVHVHSNMEEAVQKVVGL
jgi:succinyl-CoA synthetase beta subunit